MRGEQKKGKGLELTVGLTWRDETRLQHVKKRKVIFMKHYVFGDKHFPKFVKTLEPLVLRIFS